MLIIKVDSEESIDKAVKRYKKKYQKTKTINQLRSRKHFTKPSVKRRNEIIKAVYIQQLHNPDA